MTIERDGNTQCVACERCSETLDLFDRSDFEEMIENAKREGWSISRQNGEWEHRCPSCVSKENVEEAKRKFPARTTR